MIGYGRIFICIILEDKNDMHEQVQIALYLNGTTASTQEVASASEEQLSSMEEITSSSQSLSEMALDLRDMIKKFKI
jgi:methyl-accepting chemotaxis protein